MIRSMRGPRRTPSPPSAADKVNHRVANHLQLIVGFISVEARSVSDAPMLALLNRIQQRIAAIGNVHRQLYLAGGADVDLGGYLDTLGEQLAQSYAPHRRVVVDADTVPVSADIASTFGILATELITNACKHAHPADLADLAGTVFVALRRNDDGTYRFTVEDQGRGKPVDGARAGLGTRLIHALVAKLGATSIWEDARPGTRFQLDMHF